MRPHPGKSDCLVLDYGGNIKRLGFVNDVSLPQKSVSGSDVSKVKSCKKCSAFIAMTARKCSFCGAEVQSKPKEITPDKNVHRGKVLNTGTAQQANLPPKNKTKSYLKVNLAIEENNAAIFKICSADKPENIRAILVVRFLDQGLSDSEKSNKKRSLGEQVVYNATKNKHRNIRQLTNYIQNNWHHSQINILAHNHKNWEVFWQTLIELPSHSLMRLFSDYWQYLAAKKKLRQKSNSKKSCIRSISRYCVLSCSSFLPFWLKAKRIFLSRNKKQKLGLSFLQKIKKQSLSKQFNKLYSKKLIPIEKFFENKLIKNSSGKGV